MKNKLNSQLILENSNREQNKMTIFPDDINYEGQVGFTFSDQGELLTMCNTPISGDQEQYFHLDKFNVGCLIDYLKRIHDAMN